MDGLTAKVYNGVKCYWRTRGYHRLNATATTAVDGGGDDHRRRRRRSWRIRLNRRLKLKLKSPKRLFVGLRDAYVKMMMKLANTSVVRGRTMSGYSVDGFGKTMVIKEYDERIIVEICRNLAIREHHQQQISSQIACSG